MRGLRGDRSQILDTHAPVRRQQRHQDPPRQHRDVLAPGRYRQFVLQGVARGREFARLGRPGSQVREQLLEVLCRQLAPVAVEPATAEHDQRITAQP
jgi:hypothetical protein